MNTNKTLKNGTLFIFKVPQDYGSFQEINWIVKKQWNANDNRLWHCYAYLETCIFRMTFFCPFLYLFLGPQYLRWGFLRSKLYLKMQMHNRFIHGSCLDFCRHKWGRGGFPQFLPPVAAKHTEMLLLRDREHIEIAWGRDGTRGVLTGGNWAKLAPFVQLCNLCRIQD